MTNKVTLDEFLKFLEELHANWSDQDANPHLVDHEKLKVDEEKLINYMEELNMDWDGNKKEKNVHIVDNEEISLKTAEPQCEEKVEEERELCETVEIEHLQTLPPKFEIMLDPSYVQLDQLLLQSMGPERYIKTRELIENYLEKNEDKWIDVPTSSTVNAPVEDILNFLRNHFNSMINNLMMEMSEQQATGDPTKLPR